MFERIKNIDRENLKITAYVNVRSLLTLPLLAFCTPNVIRLDDERSEVKMRLDWRTQNHLRVMYFGALAMGAELSIALKAIQEIQKSKQKIDFIFQDFDAQFLKRADNHVHFICDEAAGVAALIEKAKNSPDRFAQKFAGYAVVEGKPDIPVLKYNLTLSVKNRSLKS
jgi:hypothetical protein